MFANLKSATRAKLTTVNDFFRTNTRIVVLSALGAGGGLVVLHPNLTRLTAAAAIYMGGVALGIRIERFLAARPGAPSRTSRSETPKV